MVQFYKVRNLRGTPRRPVRGIFLRMAWLLIACLGLAGRLAAQEENDSGQSSLPGQNVIKQGVLQTQARLWFKEGERDPVLIPKIDLEELLRLREEKGWNANPAQPNWSFAGLSVRVKATDPDRLIADVNADIQVKLAKADILSSIPLGFGSLRVTAWPTMTGPSEQSTFQPGASGYQWLLSGAANSQHSLSLVGQSTIVSDSDRRTLTLALPPVPCQIQVELPLGASEARVRGDDILEQQQTGEATLLKIASAGGEVVLTWRIGDSQQPAAAVEADSTTTLQFRDPTELWSASSRVDLRWYGSDASQPITIALPPGARLLAIPLYNFDQFGISREFVGDPTHGHELMRIENFSIEEKPTLNLQFEWEWGPEVRDASKLMVSLDIPHLNIEGVDAHSGVVQCRFFSQYSVTVENSQGVGLIQRSRSEDPHFPKQLTIPFEQQDFTMQVALRTEQSLPIVRPTYHVRVEDGKMTLTGWLECSFDANRYNREIGLEISGWAVQENTAKVLSDPALPLASAGELLQVRRPEDTVGTYFLKSSEPDVAAFSSGGRIEQVWRFVAELEFEADLELEIRIPEIIRDTVGSTLLSEAGSGILLVSSADNLLLRYTPGTGLLVDSYSSEYSKYIGESGVRQPQVYRFQTRLNPPYWRGTIESLPQQVTTTQKAEVSILTSQVKVRQHFQLQVANEELAELEFAIRGDANATQLPQAYVDDNVVSTQLVATLSQAELDSQYPHLIHSERGDTSVGSASLESDASDNGKGVGTADNLRPDSGIATGDPRNATWYIYRLVAPPKLLGRRMVEISSGIGWSAAEEGDNSESVLAAVVDVPLAKLLLPPETQRLSSDWVLLHGPRVDARPLLENTVSSLVNGDDGELLRPLSALRESIPLELRVDTARTSSPLRINKAWLQTAVTRLHRRDRFVAQLTTSGDEVQLSLPTFIDDIRVFVDGVSRDDYRYDNSTDSLVVKLPAASPGEHTLEVSYFQQESLAWARRIEMQCPQIQGVQSADEFYWQLLTPSVQHLAWCPESLTPEWQWTWQGLWWNRQSANVDFERLLGASKQSPLAMSLNRYVMSGQRVGQPASTWVLSRFALWFPIGSIAILGAFAVLNFSLFRSRIAMLFYALLLAALATLWPDVAMLIGQTSMLAMGLVALMWATQVAVDSRVRRRSVFTNRPLSVQDSQSQAVMGRSVALPHPSTTRAGSSIAAGGGG